ncbi:MAG: SUMF1/EgtB/PvdO family nonheme iron enzyme [Gammaproteobacteria bacterium]|nr:SUMF1/EgtB/PvdO family nonheme iron enzyme [Gammaproteobacteria bacterium]
MKKILQCVLFSGLVFFSMTVMADKDVGHYLKQASMYYNQEEYQKAEPAFRKLLKMNVSLHEDFYYFYGKTLFHNGQYKLAADNLDNYMRSVDDTGKYYADAQQLLNRTHKQLARKASQQAGKKKSQRAFPSGSKIVPEMIRISADSFIMGSKHGSPDQKPPHKMTISKDFAIGKYEVTFDQYDAFAKALKRKKPDDHGWGRGNRPVINVSISDAREYALWLSRKTRRKFRLPTETEWEYVARTGLKGQLGFTDLVGLNDANCDGCRYFWQSARTVPVGSYEANKYGIHDLFGNVWEWTCSLYTRRYNGQEQYCADKNDLQGKTLSVRGGGWNSSNQLLRSYIRYNNFPSYRSNELGFRLVEEL